MNNIEKIKSVENVFNAIANEYVEYFKDDWEFIEEIKEFSQLFNEKSTILDLGCGSGYITKYLSDLGLNAIGIDFSSEMVNIAKKRYPNVKFILDNFIDIEKSFKENSVDGLISIYSLYFIPKEQFENILKSLSKILKKNGKFLFVTQIGKGEDYITTPLMKENNVDEKLYVNYYMKEELEILLKKNNFNIEYFKSKNFVDEKEITDSGRYIVLVSKQNEVSNENKKV